MMRIQLLKNNNYTNQYYLVISLNDILVIGVIINYLTEKYSYSVLLLFFVNDSM